MGLRFVRTAFGSLVVAAMSWSCAAPLHSSFFIQPKLKEASFKPKAARVDATTPAAAPDVTRFEAVSSMLEAIRDSKSPKVGEKEYAAYRIGKESGYDSITRTVEVFSLISAPVTALLEAGRWFVLEDADSFFRPTTWDDYLFVAKDAPPIGVDEPFEITVDLIAIDNFTEGRLRDSWGGNGGQVSFQTSVNALAPSGKLLADDRRFLVTDEVKRRSPVLAALRATEKGRKAVDEIEEKAGNFLDDASNAVAKVRETVKKIASEVDTYTDPAKFDALRGKIEQRLEKELVELPWDEPQRQLARFVAEKVLDRLDQYVHGALENEILTAKEKFKKAVDRLLQPAQFAAEFFDRYGVDEEGLFERVAVIKGLADADHLSTLEFNGIRPSVFYGGGEARSDADRRSGTAEIVFNEAATDPVVLSSGVVYRGKLSELAETSAKTQGLSLSVLMLERDSDKIAQALRYVQQYADSRDIEIGSSGIEAAAIVDALAIIAEKIAEDDVELKLLDLRLFSGKPEDGGSPGRDLYKLQECSIVVARNLAGYDFGALAVIGIRKTAGHAN